MSETQELLLIAWGAGILIGLWWGRLGEARIWRGKADDSHGTRTAMCSGGRFYYVVSEHEYVEKILGLAAGQPSADGGKEGK